MTNPNDFRQYAYQYDPSYLIDGFDVSRSSTAPNRRTQTHSVGKITLHENPNVKSGKEILQDQRTSFKQAVLTVAVAVICFLLIGSVVASFAVKNECTRELAKQQTLIMNEQSEHISLQSKLDAMVSISMIDDYAVNKLGMTKVKSNQIQYMDVDGYKLSHQTIVPKGNIKK